MAISSTKRKIMSTINGKRMKATLTALVLALGLVGCVDETVGTAVMPDGSRAIVVRCHSDGAECLQKAGLECPSGYNIKDDEARGGVAVGAAASVANSSNFAVSHSSASAVELHANTLIITCHGKSRATLEAEAAAAAAQPLPYTEAPHGPQP
jgi:hypothetical protein